MGNKRQAEDNINKKPPFDELDEKFYTSDVTEKLKESKEHEMIWKLLMN
jgi:hypothetical protein